MDFKKIQKKCMKWPVCKFLRKTPTWLVIAIAVLLIFYLGAEAGYQTKYYLERWENHKVIDAFSLQIQNLFKDDTYGGKTPEETFNMFVSALKAGDVDTATKYIVLDPERRATYWKQFTDLKTQGKLQAYGEKLPPWNQWKQDKDNYYNWTTRAMIEYGQVVTSPVTVYDDAIKKNTVIEPGVYRSSMILVINSNGIWKIETL